MQDEPPSPGSPPTTTGTAARPRRSRRCLDSFREGFPYVCRVLGIVVGVTQLAQVVTTDEAADLGLLAWATGLFAVPYAFGRSNGSGPPPAADPPPGDLAVDAAPASGLASFLRGLIGGP